MKVTGGVCEFGNEYNCPQVVSVKSTLAKKVGNVMLENTADKFRDELNPGERILWSGQPQQGLMLRSGDALLIPFSLLWGGFAIFWEMGVMSSGAPFFFRLWGIPFVVLGLYIIFGRFFVDMAQRAETYYALTDQRAIILSGLFSKNVKTLKLQNLPEINISSRRDGRGTITFGASHPMAWLYSGSGFPNMGRYNIAPSFEAIEDVKTVYQQIKRLQGTGS
jgi:hypothetical protein